MVDSGRQSCVKERARFRLPLDFRGTTHVQGKLIDGEKIVGVQVQRGPVGQLSAAAAAVAVGEGSANLVRAEVEAVRRRRRDE